VRKALRTGCLLTIALAGLTLLTALYAVQVRSTSPPLNRVAAWMPTSWDAARARASWEAHRDQIQELSPVWYQLDAEADGSINRYGGACDSVLVEEAHTSGTLVIPLINNYYAGIGFDPSPVSTVVHSPTLRAAHIAALVSETLACGYDGIDIDYESLNGLDDREPFSLFVEELAQALHEEGKLLSVTVHPKTAEPGTWAGPRAQDWSRIGAAADRFRVMTYGYHWRTSPPGPIAPLFWMRDVAEFAIGEVGPHKVYLGIHFYGLDWGDGGATSLEWEGVQDLIAATGAQRRWEEVDAEGRHVAEPWFTYTVGSVQHEVWYADGESVAARLSLVREYGLGGVVLWRLGGEDPANWAFIAAALHPTGRVYLPLLVSPP